MTCGYTIRNVDGKNMPDIFKYLDYREFLDDFYLEKKRGNPRYSFQLLAQQAGFKSKSFIKLVIDGKKNLTEESADRLNKALKLPEKSFAYFKDLVEFNQSSSLPVRNYCFEKLLSYNKRSSARLLLQQQYEFYMKWYHNTIRELACSVDFKDDYEMLGKLVKPSITARKARLSVDLLKRLGLIRKKTGGCYEQVDSLITTGDDVRALAILNFHQQNLFLAGQSLETVQSAQRDVSCVILGLSDAGFGKVKNEIKKFREKLLDIAQQEKKIQNVYHLNIQLFPTSEKINDKE
jgi:uncharacterized protein (TIGR02147 family)